jgi:hypothetical protein
VRPRLAVELRVEAVLRDRIAVVFTGSPVGLSTACVPLPPAQFGRRMLGA